MLKCCEKKLVKSYESEIIEYLTDNVMHGAQQARGGGGPWTCLRRLSSLSSWLAVRSPPQKKL